MSKAALMNKDQSYRRLESITGILTSEETCNLKDGFDEARIEAHLLRIIGNAVFKHHLVYESESEYDSEKRLETWTH